MNPPFSVAAHVEGRVADAAFRHVTSALTRLGDGGRLVAITGASLARDNPAWRDGFIHLQQRGRVVFSAAIDGSVHARHGTNVDTRLTVIDRVPADTPTAFPASPGMASDAATLLAWVTAQVPPRLPMAARGTAVSTARFLPARTRSVCSPRRVCVPASATEPTDIELAYETADWKPVEGGCITDALYEGYALQSIRIAGSQAHPTRLV